MYITGRIQKTMVIGGENVCPRAIEAELRVLIDLQDEPQTEELLDEGGQGS